MQHGELTTVPTAEPTDSSFALKSHFTDTSYIVFIAKPFNSRPHTQCDSGISIKGNDLISKKLVYV